MPPASAGGASLAKGLFATGYSSERKAFENGFHTHYDKGVLFYLTIINLSITVPSWFHAVMTSFEELAVTVS